MTDSHFSNFRNRSFHNRSSSQHQSNRPSSQSQPDRLSSSSHSRFSNSQFQRQQFEFNNKFFRFFQSVQNKSFIIDENLEYINDCFEQYVEKGIENHVL